MFDFEANQIQPREELGQAPPATPVSEPPDKACRYYRELPKRLEPNETQVLDRAEETAQETLGQIQQLGVPGNGFAASLGRFFHKLAIVPETTRTEEIEQFLSQIRSKTESDNAISQLMTAIGAEARVTVLPNSLTPTGMFMAACGVSDTTGLWWSEVPYEQRPKVRIYVDTSPSMEHWRGKCVYVIDSIKEELPIAMYAFASRVMPIAVEAFAKGEYPSDNSTSFNAVIADILRNEETLAVIFTDGYALVSDDLMAEFKTTDKELYTILLGSDGDRRSNGLDLKHLSLATMSLHVRD
jgi:hypothetical protein